MSDSNRLRLAYAIESNWGEVPAVAFNELRTTGESLAHNIENTVSEEIRSDRQTTDLVQTAAEAGGDINFELSYGSYDDLLRAALFGAWTAELNIVSTSIDVDGTDNSFNSTALFGGIAVGQWIKVAGFTTAANNGYFLVVTQTASKITVAGDTLVTEIAGDSVTIDGSMLRNGVTETSLTIEKQFTDATDKNFHVHRGMMVSDLAMSIEAQAIVNGNFSFLGKDQQIFAASQSTGSIVTANTNAVMNAVNNIGSVRENGVELTDVFLMALGIEATNNLRGQNAIGALGLIGIGVGRFEITGSMTAYFENGSIYEKYVNGTESSIDFRIQDAAGNAYILTLPRVKFESGEVQAGSGNEDVMAELSYRAIRDPDTDCMFQIDRFAA